MRKLLFLSFLTSLFFPSSVLAYVSHCTETEIKNHQLGCSWQIQLTGNPLIDVLTIVIALLAVWGMFYWISKLGKSPGSPQRNPGNAQKPTNVTMVSFAIVMAVIIILLGWGLFSVFQDNVNLFGK